MISLKKTIDALIRIFDKECKPYEQRKIVFWYDTDKTAKDDDLEIIRNKLAELNIKFQILHDNYFETKKLLEHDDTTSNFLIYTQDNEKINCENWLLDIQLYSKQYRFENSRVSDIKAELGIEGFTLDKFIAEYYKFFQSKATYLKNFKELWNSQSKTENESNLLQIMIAVIAGSKRVDEGDIARKILIESIDEDNNSIWKELIKFELTDIFWEIIARKFGFTNEHPTLKKLFLSFIITHIHNNTTISLPKYESYLNKRPNESDIFLSDWINNDIESSFFDNYCTIILKENNAKFKTDLENSLKNKSLTDYSSAECPDIIEQNIIRSIAVTIHDGGKDYNNYLEIIDSRKTKHYAKQQKNQNIYNSLIYAINLLSLSEDITENIIPEKTLADLFESYTKKYYLLDTYYRKFYYYYQEAYEPSVLQDNLRQLIETNYYDVSEKLLLRWIDFIKADNNPKWGIFLKDKQKDFYKIYAKPNPDDRDKIVVIISDALRYEVAAELKEKVGLELKGTVHLEKLVSALPSTTKFGMASLLPNEIITYNSPLLKVDGKDSDGLDNRAKILKNNEKESEALQLKDFIKLSRNEAREILKGKRVVYLYHDSIDTYGESFQNEDKVFKGCQEAINELKDAVHYLTGSLNVHKVKITSDHGFIYQYDSLEKYDKISPAPFDASKIIEHNKRFIISSEKTDVDNIHRFEIDYDTDDHDKQYYIYIPYGNLRFQFPGGTRNYVHGGITPQETIIPVLSYTHIRSDAELDKKGISHGKVGINISVSSRKITTPWLKFSVLQTENVTEKRESRKVKAALYSMDGTRVSDEILIMADSPSEDYNERITPVTLTLNSNLKNGVYTLKLTDIDEKEVHPDIIEENFDLDILIDDDFDF